MIDTIRSEFLKIRTTRTAGGLFAGLLLLAGLAMWGTLANATPAELGIALSSTQVITGVLVVIPVFVLVLGIRSFTDEVRHGSIVPTFLATPDRRRVLGAKLIVITGISAVFTIAALGLGIGAAAVYFTTQSVPLAIAWGAFVTLIGKALVLSALWATIGIAVGAVVRHQVAAIVGTLAWLFVGEALIVGIAPHVGKWLPGQAGAFALGIDPATSVVTGALVLAAWAIGGTLLAGATLTRRDVV
jgi:ABC-2 type transport system permease protein